MQSCKACLSQVDQEQLFCNQCGRNLNPRHENVIDANHISISLEELEYETSLVASKHTCELCGLTNKRKLKKILVRGGCIAEYIYKCKSCLKEEHRIHKKNLKQRKSKCVDCETKFERPIKKNRIEKYHNSRIFYCIKCYEQERERINHIAPSGSRIIAL